MGKVAAELGMCDSVNEAVAELFRSVNLEVNEDVWIVELIDSVDLGTNSIELVEPLSFLVVSPEAIEVVKGDGGVGAVSMSMEELNSVEDMGEKTDDVT